MSSDSFKNVINKMYLRIIFYTYKADLALNNLQWLTCHKTKPIRLVVPVRVASVA